MVNSTLRRLVVSSLCTIAIPSMVYASTGQQGTRAAYPITKTSSQPQYISIHAGDTLWRISSQYKVSVSKLEQWNHLTDNSTLQIGKKLIIRWGAASGNVSAQRLSGRSDSAPGNLADAAFGLQVVQYAQQLIGVPYRWGGESTAGFDCSGFVRFTFAHFGIGLGRSSYDQYQEGVSVNRSDLTPGDLVFFNAYGAGASHVGIYVGGDRFINSASGGVRVDSLEESYWAGHYIGARRVH